MPTASMFKRLANWAGPGPLPGMLLGVGAVMAALYGADRFLAGLEQREIGAEARRLSDMGNAQSQLGRKDDAVDSFRRAHNLERDNHEYEIELAGAQVADNRPQAAVDTLEDVLDDDSNDGSANLLMARAMLEQGRSEAADSYYHRAIYGSWPKGEEDRMPAKVRLELVQWLSKAGNEKSLLAELIPLEEAYREILRRSPGDVEAYAGLGRVELRKGNYRSALSNFDEAMKRGAGDADLRNEADLARRARDLDPTTRHLSSADKLARSTRILSLATAAAQACPAPHAELAASAQELLSEEPPVPATNEAAETRLDLAEKLWHNRAAGCRPVPGSTDLLALLMRKIAQ